MASGDTAVVAREQEGVWRFAFGVALFGQLMNWLPSLGFTPLLPDMQREWGMSFTQLGFFTGLIGIMGIIVSLPFGVFTGRYGVKAGALVGLGCVAVGLAVVAVADGFVLGSLGRAIWMGGYRAAQVALFAATAFLAPKRVMASMMGLTFALSNLAVVIGAPLSGYVATGFGWRAAIAVFAGLGALAFLAFLALFQPAQGTSAPAPAKGGEAGPETGSAYRNSTVWLLALLTFLNAMAAGSVVYFVPSVMVQAFGRTTADVANTITLGFAIGIPMVVLAGVIADRLQARKWVVVAFNIPIVALALLLNLPDATVFAACTVAVLALAVASIALIHAIPASLLSGRELGPAFAIITLGASVQSFLGPQVLGILRDVTGSFTAGWYLIAAVTAVGIVEVIWLKTK